MNASEWLAEGSDAFADIVVLGAPISKASISPSDAWLLSLVATTR